MLELSPADQVEIEQLFHYIGLAESMTVPVEKPMDSMNLLELMKLGSSMKNMSKVLKKYGNMDMDDLAGHVPAHG